MTLLAWRDDFRVTLRCDDSLHLRNPIHYVGNIHFKRCRFPYRIILTFSLEVTIFVWRYAPINSLRLWEVFISKGVDSFTRLSWRFSRDVTWRSDDSLHLRNPVQSSKMYSIQRLNKCIRLSWRISRDVTWRSGESTPPWILYSLMRSIHLKK